MGREGVTCNECPFLLPWEDHAPAPPAVDSAGQCRDYLIDFMNLLSLDSSASRATSKTPTAAWSFFTVCSQQSIKPQSSSVAMLVLIYNKGRQASGAIPHRGAVRLRRTCGLACPRVTGKLCFARATHRGRAEGRSPSAFLMNPQEWGPRGLKSSLETTSPAKPGDLFP